MREQHPSVLIIGSGGREHALGWRLSASGAELFFAPGNAGTAALGTPVEIAPTDVNPLTDWIADKRPDLTVVGPEAPLVAGLVDAVGEIPNPPAIFGPTRDAARLEGSKAWAVGFMARHGIPHPRSRVCTDVDEALHFVNTPPWNVVIKADGLAGGKGVIVPDTRKEANAAVRAMMVEKKLGGAGGKIVIQERLFGPEVSVLAFCDGKIAVPLLSAQDHKRLLDGDAGSNTGGMGAYAPVPFVDAALFDEIHRTILQRTVDGMREEGHPYKGILYAGLMLTPAGPKVLEYNVRFGDPETQPLMMLLESDLAPILMACIEGTLNRSMVRFRPGAAACVVLASAGYPEPSTKGALIHGLGEHGDPNIRVFHAGTLQMSEGIVTSGGRVLGVTAWGETLPEAITRAYSAIGPEGIHFNGMQYRKDIGNQAI